MKPLVSQFQAQSVLPVNAGADSLRGLPVAQILHELHDTDQRELPRMEGWLPVDGVDGAEELIVKEGSQLIAEP